ncbi:MAG: DUF2378 family protein [Myxococcales bacterium]|nr:DUF2378 family protein [Myxococcales bacterium]
MKEHLWYGQVVEAIFIKGLGPRLTPQVAALVKQEGINLDKLLPGYPVGQVVKACHRVLPALFPGMPMRDAMAELGALSTRGYNETLVGRAAIAFLKLIGTRRALESLNKTLSAGNNYLQTQFTALSGNQARIHLSDASGVPDFYRGLIEEGGRLLGAKGFKVDNGAATAPAHEFLISWDA